MFTLKSSWATEKEKLVSNIFPENSVVLIDCPEQAEINKNNILILVEPEIILRLRRFVIDNIQVYDTVWTCDDVLLRLFPEKARLFLGSGGSSIRPPTELLPKEFKISSLTGTKVFPGVIGHQIRLPIYFRQKEFPPHTVFFRSSHGEPLPEIGNNPFVEPMGMNVYGRVKIFDGFQFSIQIENSQQINYFTDRILDCLQMKTIPIYWGCPNIGEFFDTTGWVFFDGSVEDLLQKVRALTPDHYDKHIDSINANYEKSMKYGYYFYELFNYQALSQ